MNQFITVSGHRGGALPREFATHPALVCCHLQLKLDDLTTRTLGGTPDIAGEQLVALWAFKRGPTLHRGPETLAVATSEGFKPGVTASGTACYATPRLGSCLLPLPPRTKRLPAPTLVLGRYKDLVSKNEDWGRQEGRESKDTVKPSASHGCPR